MHTKRRRNTPEILLILGLLLVFVFSAFVLVIMGADTYGKIAEDMQSNFERRTPLSYIATKIREQDHRDGISIEQKEGRHVLVIKQTIEKMDYETWIYEYEGDLRELFIEKGTPLTLEDGMSLIEIQGLKLEEIEPGLLRIGVKDHLGKTLELVINIKSET